MRHDDDQHPSTGPPTGRTGHRAGRAQDAPGQPLGPDTRGQRRVRSTMLLLPVVGLGATAGMYVLSARAGWALWHSAVATIAVGLVVIAGGLWLVKGLLDRSVDREQASFRRTLAQWAHRRGWQVRTGADPGTDEVPGISYPEHVRAEAVEAVACSQIIEGRDRNRAVRIESWQVRYRVPGSPGTFRRRQQLLRLNVGGPVPAWMLLPSERTAYAIPDTLRPARLLPGPQGTAIVDPDRISAEFDGDLVSFAQAVRTTGAHAVWSADEVVLLFPSDAIPRVQDYRMGLAHQMADTAAQLADRRHP